MELSIHLVTLLAYVSLVIELTFLHVPSVASGRSIWVADDRVTRWYSGRYVRVFHMQRWLKLLLFLPLLTIVYAVFLFPVSALFFDVRPPFGYVFEPAAPLLLLSLCFVGAGRVFTLSAVLAMNRAAAAQTSSRLFTEGPFRYSRNPGLAGMFLMFAGFLIILPSPLFLAGILIYAAYMNFKVKMEEDFLSHRYGDEFATYRSRTGRYFP